MKHIPEILLVTAIIGGIALIYFAVRSASRGAKHQEQKIIQRYQECKEKTQDLEYCFKLIYRKDVNK